MSEVPQVMVIWRIWQWIPSLYNPWFRDPSPHHNCCNLKGEGNVVPQNAIKVYCLNIPSVIYES